MSHVSDFTQSEDKIVLDLINYDNGSNLTLEQVRLGDVRQDEDGTVSLTVSSILGSGYSESQDVSYNRVSLDDIANVVLGQRLSVVRNRRTMVSEMLDEINLALGVAILPEAIVDTPLPPPSTILGSKTPTSLILLETNKVYDGRLVFDVETDIVQLSAVIATNVLSGLNLPYRGETMDLIRHLGDDVLNGF